MLALTDNKGDLIFPEQTELAIALPKRGNPNWVSKYKAGKTTPIRIPNAHIPAVRELVRQLDSGDQQIIATAAPSGVRDVAIDSLRIAPEIFQYKVIHGSTGRTGSLKGVRTWDPNLAGLVLVWYNPQSGVTFVVNGHNRVDLAKSLGVNSVTVRFLDCATAKEARVIGALANLSEGRGNAIDCAKFLRDSGLGVEDLKARGIPLGERTVSDGLAMSRLADHLWQRTFTGELDQELAIAVGESLEDHEEQTALVQMVEKDRRKLSREVVRELAETIKSSEFTQTTEITLFGIAYTNQSLAIERSQINALVKNRLSREKRLFGSVAKSKTIATLSKVGNKIEQLASKQASERSESALIYFDRFKLLSGELSSFISKLAKQVSGKNLTVELAADQVIGYLQQDTNHWQELDLG